MTTYEELLDSVCNKNILVHENYDFSDTHLKGLYCDSHIALSKNLATTTEKNVFLLKSTNTISFL